MPLRHFGARHFSGLRHFFAIHFSGIRVQVSVGGGGGPYPLISRGPGFYTLDPRFLTKTTKYVMINVEFGEKKWKKHYVVETAKADLVITVLNWANRLKDGISVGIEKFRRVSSKVTALFSRGDK